VAGPAAGDGAAPMGLGRGQRAGPKGWSNHGQTRGGSPAESHATSHALERPFKKRMRVINSF
jgi:hypothetical protein